MYSDPLAYFLTWTTYGTWLPGDERGWITKPGRWEGPDAMRKFMSQLMMTEEAITLDKAQRQCVETTIRRHCEIRHWHLHAVNCRSNHVHVVVTAPGVDRVVVMEQFKAWCTRELKKLAKGQGKDELACRTKWWTERGSKPYLFSDDELFHAVQYVIEEQEGVRFEGQK